MNKETWGLDRPTHYAISPSTPGMRCRSNQPNHQKEVKRNLADNSHHFPVGIYRCLREGSNHIEISFGKRDSFLSPSLFPASLEVPRMTGENPITVIKVG